MNPLLLAFVVALFANLLVVGVIVGMVKGQQITAACQRGLAQLKRLFTKAGDGCPNCSQWQQPVHCLRCHRTRMLRPAEEIPTPTSLSAAAIDEELRRRQALSAWEDFDEIESAVN